MNMKNKTGIKIHAKNKSKNKELPSNEVCDGDEAEDKEALMVNMRSYFNLCAQEYFMYRQGVIEEEIWHNWEVGLIHCMKLPAFREAYFKLNAMSAYREFHDWLSTKVDMDSPSAEADGVPVESIRS